MHQHPTISLWQREEDGSYKAELEGFALHVSWVPESNDKRRGFRWKAVGVIPEATAQLAHAESSGNEPAGEITLESEDVVEEIEQAMALAEANVKHALHPERI